MFFFIIVYLANLGFEVSKHK